MKIFFVLLLAATILSGCAAEQTFETLSDVYSPQEQVIPRDVRLSLPTDAAAQVISGEGGTLYLCDGYEITQQILPSGNLESTIRTLTGYDKDRLTVIETGLTDVVRYECVWTAAGEEGDCIGRAAVLDDGCHHYCLTVMADADSAGDMQATWKALFDSYGLD